MARVLQCIYILSTATFLLVSCNKYLDTTPTRADGEENHWQSYEDVHSGLMSFYGLMRSAMANNNAYWLYGELRNGDFTAVSRTDLKAIIEGQLNVSFSTIEDVRDWRRFYAVVNACNLFIERSPEALKDARYTKLNNKVDLAQAHVMRAFAYYNLVRIWGDVPLITGSYDGQFPAKERTSKDLVLDFAQNEIINYVNDLPYVYGVANDPILPGNYYGYDRRSYYNTLFNRVNSYIVLAHISALRSRYDEVNVYCKYVLDNYTKINAGYATSVTDVTNSNALFYDRDDRQLVGFTFIQNNGEEGTSGIGHIESMTLAAPLISRTKPDIYVTRDSINSVFRDSKDTRFGIDTVSGLKRSAYFTNYDADIPIFSKIKVIDNVNPNGQFAIYGSAIVFSRLEEVTLLRAEALAVLGLNSDAAYYLNIIRNNRGLSSYSSSVDGDLVDAIFSERRKELMGEGWRWFDLVRYNKIKGTNQTFNNLIATGGIYWPVSSAVLESNSLIQQNSYWK